MQKVEVPMVPGAFVLTHILSAQDCLNIIRLVDTIGFQYDIPVGQDQDQRA